MARRAGVVLMVMLTEAQKTGLRRIAAGERASMTDVIRRWIDEALDPQPSPTHVTTGTVETEPRAK